VLGYIAAIVIAGIENAVMMVGVIDRSWKLKLTASPNQGCAQDANTSARTTSHGTKRVVASCGSRRE
jgi:hypothetical protein